MPDIYSEFDEVAATIPAEYLRNLSTHGDAVVVAKRIWPYETAEMIDNLASAIEKRVGNGNNIGHREP